MSQNIMPQHCKYCEHAPFKQNIATSKNLEIHKVCLIKYEYLNALYRGDCVKPDTFDHEMLFPDQELFVLLLWMYRKTILKHLLHLHIIFSYECAKEERSPLINP